MVQITKLSFFFLKKKIDPNWCEEEEIEILEVLKCEGTKNLDNLVNHTNYLI